MRIFLLVVAASTLVACGGEHRSERSGELAVCAGPPPGPSQVMGFQDGDPVQMYVSYQGCLSGSCTGDYKGSCSVSRSGNTLNVKSDVSWARTGEEPCTFDCRGPTATCWSKELEAGSYELKFGDKTVPFVVGADASQGACIR